MDRFKQLTILPKALISRFQKDRALGVAEGKRQYDLPLNKDASAGFLRLLIGLMSFIAVMALCFSFALEGLAERWSSGLENKLTIEVPALTASGEIRKQEEIETLQQKVAEKLENNPNIKNFDLLDHDEMQNLIKPWFGEELVLSDIPLPGLISVDMHISSQETMSRIRSDMREVDKSIEIDAHETWLNEVLRFAGNLQMIGVLISFVILVTTITAVAGAVRSRLAIHHADVELLHLMGASDLYITKQFQKHALTLAAHGSVAGTFLSLIILFLIGGVLGAGEDSMMPDMHIGFGDFIIIMLLPVLACAIAAITARITVLKALSLMP